MQILSKDMQILNLCDIGEWNMEQLHFLYDMPIAPPPRGRRRRGHVQDDKNPIEDNTPPCQHDEVHHNVEYIPHFTQKQTQNDAISYTPMIMM